ncbi:MAG: phasin family protein [Rhodocyclaceae bacterium]|nr:phasin family protein [Rhodocyclaceae bacterium]
MNTKLPNPEALVAATKANVESALSVANIALTAIERLSALNLSVARGTLDDGAASAKALLAVKDASELPQLDASLAQPAVEKASAYSRNVYEILSQTQSDLGKIFEAKAAEVEASFTSALEEVAKSSPVGSEAALAAVKQAVSAANTSYESVKKAVTDLSALVESNLAAAGSVAAPAAAAKSSKKKA